MSWALIEKHELQIEKGDRDWYARPKNKVGRCAQTLSEAVKLCCEANGLAFEEDLASREETAFNLLSNNKLSVDVSEDGIQVYSVGRRGAECVTLDQAVQSYCHKFGVEFKHKREPRLESGKRRRVQEAILKLYRESIGEVQKGFSYSKLLEEIGRRQSQLLERAVAMQAIEEHGIGLQVAGATWIAMHKNGGAQQRTATEAVRVLCERAGFPSPKPVPRGVITDLAQFVRAYEKHIGPLPDNWIYEELAEDLLAKLDEPERISVEHRRNRDALFASIRSLYEKVVGTPIVGEGYRAMVDAVAAKIEDDARELHNAYRADLQEQIYTSARLMADCDTLREQIDLLKGALKVQSEATAALVVERDELRRRTSLWRGVCSYCSETRENVCEAEVDAWLAAHDCPQDPRKLEIGRLKEEVAKLRHDLSIWVNESHQQKIVVRNASTPRVTVTHKGSLIADIRIEGETVLLTAIKHGYSYSVTEEEAPKSANLEIRAYDNSYAKVVANGHH